MKRRDFLGNGVIASAFALQDWTPSQILQASLQPRGVARKIIIVGGGLAGLSAGYDIQ